MKRLFTLFQHLQKPVSWAFFVSRKPLLTLRSYHGLSFLAIFPCMEYKLTSEFKPTGDQPKAIAQLGVGGAGAKGRNRHARVF